MVLPDLLVPHRATDRGKASIVMVVALAITMAPVLWVILPPIFDVVNASSYGDYGPGAEAMLAVLPISVVLILFGWVVAVIIKR